MQFSPSLRAILLGSVFATLFTNCGGDDCTDLPVPVVPTTSFSVLYSFDPDLVGAQVSTSPDQIVLMYTRPDGSTWKVTWAVGETRE